jgi:hypothetical protein
MSQGSALVTVLRGTEERIVEALRRLDDVTVVEDAPECALVMAGRVAQVRIAAVGREQLEELLRVGRTNEGQHLAVVNAILDDGSAARLEDAGIAYVDASGRGWLPGRPRTRRRRIPDPGALRAPRGASLRLAQLLADHPDRPWTERGLAERGESTQVTAHRLLTQLESRGLVERTGTGRGASRRVVDAQALRSWLARHGRPGRTQRLACFLPDSARIAAHADPQLVLTGALAAERLGMPVLTAIPRATYRVRATGEALEQIPTALGGFRTERGANAVLIADPERLADLDAGRLADGQAVAPLSRIMLDLHLEPRGKAAVSVFLDLWSAATAT